MQSKKPALAYGVKKVEYARRMRDYQEATAPVVASNGMFSGLKKLFS